MCIRKMVLAMALVVLSVPALANVSVLADPDKWIVTALQDLADGKTDEVARSYVTLIDKPDSFDAFAGNLRVMTRMGHPAFVEKVSEAKFGSVLREVIYVALYQQATYVYFKFTIKKNRGGWLISNFEFKSESGDLFPAGFASPK